MKGSTGNKLIFVIFLIVEDRNLISFIASTIFWDRLKAQISANTHLKHAVYRVEQGIIDPTGMEIFAKKKPQFSKLLRGLNLAPVPCGVIKKVHWFFSYVCNFVCFAAG